MKKDDVIERITVLESGRPLLYGIESREKAEISALTVDMMYNFTKVPEVKVVEDSLNLDKFAVVSCEESSISVRAKVNWIVENEVGITHLTTGGCEVLDLGEEENKGWVVVVEAAPVYQSSVDNMTDDQLRESIERLRSNRINQPPRVVRAKAEPKVSALSQEDKNISKVLGSMTSEQKIELQRKLGLID